MDIRLLGGVQILVDGQPRHLEGRSLRLILALLVIHRRSVVPLDTLVDALWGDHPPPTAKATMQTHVSKLRRLLTANTNGDEAKIRNVAPGYVLDIGPSHVDVDRFELALTRARNHETNPDEVVGLLEEALADWSGAAYSEFADEHWARTESMRLEELRLVAIEDLNAARLALGGHALVVGELGSQVQQHPFRERMWGQLILALHRSGRQGEALRIAHQFRRQLGEELGLEPSPEICELERAVAADDNRLRLPDPTPTAEPSSPRIAHLPVAATDLIGRQDELMQMSHLLPTTRLLTLSGPGGVGKSSLALAMAHDLHNNQQRNVRFVELAPVRETSAVAAAIAQVLDIERRPGRSLEESIIDVLASLKILLILDNCEHVLDAVAPLVQEIIRWCPGIHVLTTSREPIGMAGEVVLPVMPLGVPSDDDITLTAIAQSPAVQVFIARAREVAPKFVFTDTEAPAIAELCIQLDGLPLALELAAARMAVMNPRQLADRLHERFVLLGSGRSRDPRHRTLLDLVQWSYELLSPIEQSLFDRLSVFVDGFDLPSAEQVCGVGGFTPADVATPLTHLVEKSLVTVNSDRGRYRQLETLRQYGVERLATRPEANLVQRGHIATYVALAEKASLALETPNENVVGVELDAEIGNLRAAMSAALDGGDAESALRLVAATHEWAFRRIRYEIADWAESAIALDNAQDHPLLPVSIAVAGYCRFVRGELTQAIELAEHALAVSHRLSVPSSGLPERVLGNALFYRGDHTRALWWMDRMVDAAVSSGVPGRMAHAFYMRSVAQTSIGDLQGGAAFAVLGAEAANSAGSGTAHSQSLYATAFAAASEGQVTGPLDLLMQSAQVAEMAGNRWMRAFAMTEAMWLMARHGDPHDALAGYGEVIEIWYRGGDWANQWLSLRQLAGTLAAIGCDEQAALIMGAVDAAGATTALPFAPSDTGDLQQITRELHQRLGSNASERAQRYGATMRDDMVVNFALKAVLEASTR